MNWLNGKTVLVTGATGGLGRPLCQAFSALGATVLGADLAPAVASAIPSGDNRVSPGSPPSSPWTKIYALDVTSLDDWRTLHQQTGEIDVLIHNAGITALACFRDGGSSMVEKIMAVNFFGTVYGTQTYLPGLRRRAGRLAILSSVAGFAPLYGRTAYAASKHALHGFYGSLQAEERDSGLCVTLVSPSFIATGIRRQLAAPPAGGKLTQDHELSPDEVARRIATAVNHGRRRLRVGKTAQVAWWLNFLLPALYERLMVRATASHP